MKALSIILGIVLIVGGVLAIAHPAWLLLSLGALMGLFILAHGVGSLITCLRFGCWAEGWGVAGAILSILLGALLTASTLLGATLYLMLVFAAGLWVLSTGVVCVAMAARLSRVSRLIAWNRRSRGWMGLMLLGVVLMALGVTAFLHPMVSALTAGVLLGVYVVASGVSLIATACCRPEY